MVFRFDRFACRYQGPDQPLVIGSPPVNGSEAPGIEVLPEMEAVAVLELDDPEDAAVEEVEREAARIDLAML
jgi:hypothetical protein